MTYSCRKPACANRAIGCVNHIQAVVQPYGLIAVYAFTFAICQRQKPTVDWIATNLLTPEVWTAWLTDGCPGNRTPDTRLRVRRLDYNTMLHLLPIVTAIHWHVVGNHCKQIKFCNYLLLLLGNLIYTMKIESNNLVITEISEVV